MPGGIEEEGRDLGADIRGVRGVADRDESDLASSEGADLSEGGDTTTRARPRAMKHFSNLILIFLSNLSMNASSQTGPCRVLLQYLCAAV